MKKPNDGKSDELRKEYRFDYSRSRKNRFAGRIEEGSVLVVLEPDVASVFKDSDSVNELLRSVAKAVNPAGIGKKAAVRQGRKKVSGE